MNCKLILFYCLLIGSLLSCNTQQQQYPSGIEHVIIIGVDGLSPDGIHRDWREEDIAGAGCAKDSIGKLV
ncbi:MAG: hypothetical protein ABIN89_18880 [Chitinophagaceae bacterium]